MVVEEERLKLRPEGLAGKIALGMKIDLKRGPYVGLSMQKEKRKDA